MRLTELPHQSDKGVFLEHYERHFAAIAGEPLVLLELGIDRGASLLLWRDFFPRATIVGLDKDRVELADDSGRIKIYQGLQEDPELLERIAREQAPGGFDVIIDDAAHLAAAARASFRCLFDRHLKHGGLYAIEDWGTGYRRDWPDGRAFEPNHSHGMVGFIKELVDEVGAGDPVDGAPSPRSRIARLEIHPGLVFALRR